MEVNTEYYALVRAIKEGWPEILPGSAAHRRMAPPGRFRDHGPDPTPPDHARPGAVLVLLYPNPDLETQVVLTLRKAYDGPHSAQVSFPGGKPEPSDQGLRQTALREAQEEIGIAPHEVQMVAELTPLYIPPSNFLVYPFLGLCEEKPRFVADPKEVELILEPRLCDVINPSNRLVQRMHTRGGMWDVPTLQLEGQVIWGATAMILEELAWVISEIKPRA
jgi:8-oxo-dGTP pyrophosphatase MutT (NUDIX family)